MNNKTKRNKTSVTKQKLDAWGRSQGLTAVRATTRRPGRMTFPPFNPMPDPQHLGGD